VLLLSFVLRRFAAAIHVVPVLKSKSYVFHWIARSKFHCLYRVRNAFIKAARQLLYKNKAGSDKKANDTLL
jgi:hypothetical protein